MPTDDPGPLPQLTDPAAASLRPRHGRRSDDDRGRVRRRRIGVVAAAVVGLSAATSWATAAQVPAPTSAVQGVAAPARPAADPAHDPGDPGVPLAPSGTASSSGDDRADATAPDPTDDAAAGPTRGAVADPTTGAVVAPMAGTAARIPATPSARGATAGAATTPSATGTAARSSSRRQAPTAAPTSPPSAAAPDQAGRDPLAGMTFYGPNTGAATAAAAAHGADAAALGQLAAIPTARWLGAWSGDVTQTVRQVLTAARTAGGVPVFVAYDIPDRDCGGQSAGGAQSAADYGQWIRAVAAGIGTATAVVVVEPDALAQLCGDPAARLQMLHDAVDVLEANPGTHTYLDAGNPGWIDAGTMAQRLRAAGVADADGFAVNVSNFQTTADDVTFGRAISAVLGGAHFVVDTSRNGNGPGSDWCNPAGRAVGSRPTASTGQALVDAYLWVKTPGESDGTCNGGPAAGVFWTQYALALMRAA